MIKIICDRCGAEMKENEEVGYVAIGVNSNPLSNDVMYNSGVITNHFCADCINKIKDFMKSEPVIDPAPKPKPKAKSKVKPPDILSATPEPEKPKRRKIDIGKIMALKNAGWSREKIADEMGMTPNAVSNAVYAYKKKRGEL